MHRFYRLSLIVAGLYNLMYRLDKLCAKPFQLRHRLRHWSLQHSSRPELNCGLLSSERQDLPPVFLLVKYYSCSLKEASWSPCRRHWNFHFTFLFNHFSLHQERVKTWLYDLGLQHCHSWWLHNQNEGFRLAVDYIRRHPLARRRAWPSLDVRLGELHSSGLQEVFEQIASWST